MRTINQKIGEVYPGPFLGISFTEMILPNEPKVDPD